MKGEIESIIDAGIIQHGVCATFGGEPESEPPFLLNLHTRIEGRDYLLVLHLSLDVINEIIDLLNNAEAALNGELPIAKQQTDFE